MGYKESNLFWDCSSEDGYSKGWLMLGCMVLSWIIIHRWSQRNRKGPKTWPLVGAAIEQLMNYNRMHDWLVKYLSESNSVVVPMPFTTYTYIADPANVEHVLKTNFPNYPKGEVYQSYMEVLLGDGIFNSDGELWRKQRKTASFEFASKNLRDFSTVVFRDYSLKLHAILSRASFQGQQVDMQELLMRMTLDSICKVGFGVEIGTLAPNLPDNQFAQAFDTPNEDGTGHSVQIFHIHFSPWPSSRVQDDDNSINEAWLEAYSCQTLIGRMMLVEAIVSLVSKIIKSK